MYEGPLAEAIIAAVQEDPRPGLLTLKDMKNYQPQKNRGAVFALPGLYFMRRHAAIIRRRRCAKYHGAIGQF